MKKLLTIVSMLWFSLGFKANAQLLPSSAPSSSIQQQIGISQFTVQYNRPAIDKKTVFTGDHPLIPFKKLWNTSINLAANTDFAIANQYFKAGKYTLYAIPEPEKWTLVFKKINAETDDQDEVFRTTVTPFPIAFTETLEAGFKSLTDSTALFTISWADFSLSVKIAVSTNALVLAAYQKELLKKPNDSRTLQYGTWFLMTRNFELPIALKWIDLDISRNETYYAQWLKAQVLRKLSRNDEAIKAAHRALDLAQVSSDIDYGTYVPRIKSALDFWHSTPDSKVLGEKTITGATTQHAH